jgi:hypothetical protein
MDNPENDRRRLLLSGILGGSVLPILAELLGNLPSIAAQERVNPTITLVNTVSDLKALPENPGGVAFVLGYHVQGDGGGGLFLAERSTPSRGVDRGITLAGLAGLHWVRLSASDVPVNVKWFGARGDGIADDTEAIQAALDFLHVRNDLHSTSVVYCPPGTYRISRTIVLDSYRISLIAECYWDASSISSGAALQIISSVGSEPAYSYGRKGRIEGLRISGGKRRAKTIGIDFNSPTEFSNANMLLVRCAISGMGIGIRHANRAYNSTALQCEVFDCNVCVSCPTGFADYGERLSYLSCVLYNSTLAVEIANPYGAFFFTNCSFDYNAKLFSVILGQIICTSCHFESSAYRQSPIFVAPSDSNLVRVIGGYFSTQGVPGSQVPPYIVEVGAGSEVHFDSVSMGYTRTSSDSFWGGEGRCFVRNRWISYIHENPRQMHPNRSFLVDGSFEQSRIIDPIWINADTSMIIDRHTGSNIQLRISNEAAHSGKQSLKYSKVLGSGSLSSFILLLLSVDPHDRIGWTFWHRLGRRHPSANEKATLYYGLSWAKMLSLNPSRIPQFEYQVSFGSAPFEATSQWAQIASSTGREYITPPQWATHFLLEINGVSVNASDILFDDVQAWST